MSTAAEKWAEQAKYDLDTAHAMLASERYLYVLFCCQQALEKALKAVIAQRTGEFPPRIHNLARLAEAAGLKLDKEQTDWLTQLSSYCIQTRYPEDIDALGTRVSRSQAAEAWHKSEAITQWVLSQLR